MSCLLTRGLSKNSDRKSINLCKDEAWEVKARHVILRIHA
jgi:hypothetical protein